MNYILVTAQTLSIAAMILTILSMQCRSTRNLFICQESAGLLFTVSFFMLGAWSGALMNFFGIIRPEILRHEKTAKSKWVLAGLILFLLLCSASAIIFFKEKWHLMLIVTVAQIAGTYGMWTRDGKLIRIFQAAGVSPLWLLYNFLLPIPSIGGILNETICLASTCIALYRYRKIGFTQR